MKNQITAFTRLKGKKRYIALALISVELMSLPAAAQIMQRVNFDARPSVTAVEVPTAEPGLSRFLVASNSGFGIQASDVSGNVDVKVRVSGSLNGTSRFGDAAQLPGAESSCGHSTGLASPIYIASQKTAARDGTPPEQAVIFEFRYAPDARPTFEFKSDVDTLDGPSACFDEEA